MEQTSNLVKGPWPKKAIKTKHKHGKEKKSFVYIDRAMIDTFAWKQLTPVDQAVLLRALYIYNGSNNGYLSLSCRALATELNVSKDSANRALKNLMTFGFIKPMKAANWSPQARQPAEYALTFRPCDRTNTPASREYQRVGKVAPPDPSRRSTGTDCPSGETRNRYPNEIVA